MAVRGMGSVPFGAALYCTTKKNEMEFLCLVLFHFESIFQNVYNCSNYRKD